MREITNDRAISKSPEHVFSMSSVFAALCGTRWRMDRYLGQGFWLLPGEAVIMIKRQGGKRSIPCSGKVLFHSEMREGGLVALKPSEQNFGG